MSVQSFITASLAHAVRDGKSNDASTYNAITSLSAYMAARLVDQVMDSDDGNLDDKRLNVMWKAYLTRYAYLGGIVWEGTDHEAGNIAALPAGERRAKAAKEYVEKKPKGARLVASLTTRKTYVRRLVKDTLENHAGIFRDILATAQSGADAEALAGLWQAHVEHWYGSTLSALCAALQGERNSTPQKTELEKIMARAEKWELAMLEEITAALVKRRDAMRDDAAGLGDIAEMEVPATMLHHAAYTTRDSKASGKAA